MKRVYSSADFAFVGYVRSVLEQAGISCHMRNEHLLGGAGDLPTHEVWPELWIIDDAQEPAASELLAALLAEHPHSKPWRCTSCGEMIEPQFGACWACYSGDCDELLA